MRLAIRHSLIAVALLGAVTCVVAVYVLTRFIATSSSHAMERFRDRVTQQLESMDRADAHARLPGPTVLPSPAVGLRAGYLPRGSTASNIPIDLEPPLASLLDRSLRSAEQGPAVLPVVLTSQDGDRGAVAGALVTAEGDVAWAAVPLRPPPSLAWFRFVVLTLGVAGIALVIVSAHMATSLHRGAVVLKNSLRSLASDFDAPVPRPSIRELNEVAEGIAGLASDLRRAERDKSRLSRELGERERLASLGRVAAGIAHEVRNPLAAIKLRVDLVRMDPAIGSETMTELGEVSAEVTRLDRLVSDLLVIAGRRTGPRVQTDLRALVDRRVLNLAAWAQERGVQMVTRGSAAACIDSDAVARAIDNVLRNAVEASSADGLVEVNVSSDGSRSMVEVMDHGSGLDRAREHELFEPFFTTKPEGTGLGLALSRAIAQAHGGTLSYRRDGGITVFELELASTGQETDEPRSGRRGSSRPTDAGTAPGPG